MVTNDVSPKKLNWPVLLADIKKAGYSYYEVAKRLGKSESTIQSWLKGHEPSHSNGQAIIELYGKVFGIECDLSRYYEEVV